MPNLSSPASLIKSSFLIFFKKENLVGFLKIYAPFVLTGIVSLIVTKTIGVLVLVIAGYIISLWVQVSGYFAVKRAVEGASLDFVDIYKASWGKILGLFSISLLFGLGTVFGLLLLIIPGVVFAVYYSFSFFNFINGEGVIQSMKTSKALVAGKFWPVLGRILVFLLFAVLVQMVFSLIPQFGTLILSLFGALFILPNYLLYKELQAYGRTIPTPESKISGV